MDGAGTLIGLSLIAVSLPFVLAVLIALRPQYRPRSVDDYFLYDRSLTAGDFLKTSVGYSLQVAAIVLFLQWVFFYGSGALFVPVAWAAGYFLLYAAVRARKLDAFLLKDPSQGSPTIHGYLGDRTEGKAKTSLVRIAALTTVIGLGGTLIAEIDYATGLSLDLLRIETQKYQEVTIHIAILIFTGCYVLWGGYKAVVATDRFQVPIAYFTFGGLLIAVATLAEPNFKKGGVLICLLTVVLFATFYLSRRRIQTKEPTYSLLADRIILWGLCAIGLAAAIFFWVEDSESGEFPLSMFSFPDERLFGFGLIGVISLALANGIWQFVDISSLQRLQSLEIRGGAQHKPDLSFTRVRILSALQGAALEAAGVWVLVIFLGFALRMAGVESYDALPTFFTTDLQGPSILLLPALLFSVAVFMMSTVDGFISASAFVAYYDLRPRESDVLSQGPGARPAEMDALRIARWVTVVTLVVIYAGYIVLREALEQRIDAVLYAIYAFQIAIGPTVLLAFFRLRSFRAIPAIVSILAGWILALVTALTDPWLGIPLESWYVVPPLAAFLGAILGYIIAALIQAGWGRLVHGRT